jgi:S-adenosylmethionine-diacylglycerol 3-amino-3-carboxypropyl transferase
LFAKGKQDVNSKALIDAAVLNSTTSGRKGLADRLFARWFNRLVYAQIWEDPVADLAALALRPGAHVLTIASGGCNALAYLSAQPGAVHAVDLNAAHLATLALKRAALRGLDDYDALLAFLGDAAQPENRARYREAVAPHLEPAHRAWWAGRDLLGRRRYGYFARHFYRRGLLGEFIALSHPLVRLLGGNLGKMAQADSPEAQRALFDRHVAPVFRHALVRFLANRPMALYSLGIPPSQFEAIRRDAPDGVAADFCERMRRLLCDWPIEANCFAMQAVHRRYDTGIQSSLPLYLQREHHAAVRAGLDALHLHHASLTGFLASQPKASLDAYLFLDAQDWMDGAQLTALWTEVTRTAAPGARVVFRTGGTRSPLASVLPGPLLAQWHTDPARNRALHATDRAAIYGGMHLYEKRA